MRPSVVKAKLQRNEPVLITALHFTDPSLYEITARMGFDAIWMDLEHASISLETAANLMRATRTGRCDCLARPANGEFMRLGRLLEAGAQGIMYPRCRDAAEAAEVVKWAKFAPLGQRGCDGGNPDMPHCTMNIADYVAEANRQTWIVVQLEDPQALEHAEAIAAVPGVDAIFLGTCDFSVLGGFPGDFDHPRIQAAIDRTARAAKNAGKHWGTPSGTPQRATELMELGARLICSGADIIFVKNALEAMQKDYGQLGFTFNNEFAGKGRNYYA